MKDTIAVVIVTFNRLQLLKEVLNAFENQTVMPEHIIVVNNASSDGTKEYLTEWSQEKTYVEILNLPENLGGSGGFYEGTKEAVRIGADWVWVSDDDAVPERDAIEKAKKHIKSIKNPNKISAICAAIYTDGKIAESNRNYREKKFYQYKLREVPTETYQKKYFEVNCFSYVGVLINSTKLEKVGLIHQEYFIWLDDVEHSWRLNDVGKIICFPDIKVDHRANKADYALVSWKTYYGYRNDLLMLKEHASARYYFFKKMRIFSKGLKSKNPVYFKVCKDAIHDADNNITGKHSVYAPGWKAE